jgi:hypothetical protein
MPGARTDKRANVDKVRDAALRAGYTVTERLNHRLTLDITTDPSVYQFEAYFKETKQGFWGWDIGYRHNDGGADKIHTMQRLIEGLSSAARA